MGASSRRGGGRRRGRCRGRRRPARACGHATSCVGRFQDFPDSLHHVRMHHTPQLPKLSRPFQMPKFDVPAPISSATWMVNMLGHDPTRPQSAVSSAEETAGNHQGSTYPPLAHSRHIRNTGRRLVPATLEGGACAYGLLEPRHDALGCGWGTDRGGAPVCGDF